MPLKTLREILSPELIIKKYFYLMLLSAITIQIVFFNQQAVLQKGWTFTCFVFCMILLNDLRYYTLQNAEPHPFSYRFGSEKWLKYFIRIFLSNHL